MNPDEHAFYMGKLAELEVRIIRLEQQLTGLGYRRATPKPAQNDGDAETAVRKMISLN